LSHRPWAYCYQPLMEIYGAQPKHAVNISLTNVIGMKNHAAQSPPKPY